MRRTGIGLALLIAAAALLVGTVPQLRSALVGNLRGPSEESASFSVGDLSDVYLSKSQLAELGVDADPTSVRYADRLEPDKLRKQVPLDDIPSIDGPEFEGVEAAEEWLNDDDRVLAVKADGSSAKAYPIRILNWHEIVNDTIGDTPIVVTFCPLCQSGLVFVRPKVEGERIEEFGVTGRLYHSNLVMYDRTTGTFWDQLNGAPLVGPWVGKVGSLERYPSRMAKWGKWKDAHPDGRVLARPTTADPLGGEPPRTDDPDKARRAEDYSFNPYADYLESNYGTFGTLVTDDRLVPKRRIVGVAFGEQAKAYPEDAVRKAGWLQDRVGGTPVLLVWDPTVGDVVVFKRSLPGDSGSDSLDFETDRDTLVDTATQTRWSWDGRAVEGPLAEQGAQLERVHATQTFWFAWAALHDDTALYTP